MNFRNLLFPILTITLLGYSSLIQAEGSAITCDDEGSCRIAYEYLATQETDPFLFLGKPMNEERPRWSQYRRVLKRYPDVPSCLVAEEREKAIPNLLLINWPELQGPSLDVCLFRIFSSLEGVDQVIEWMEYHEFKIKGPEPYFSGDYIYKAGDTALMLWGYWSIEQLMERRPTLLWRLFEFNIAYNFSISVRFFETGKLAGVRVSSAIE